MGAIFRREVRSYFTSPIGYIFLAAFYAYSGVMFANYSLESGYTRLDSVFSALLIIIIVLIPVLTMRTISEEKRTKAFSQLSYPLSVRLTGTSLWAISLLWHLLAALISLSVSSAHLSQKTR